MLFSSDAIGVVSNGSNLRINNQCGIEMQRPLYAMLECQPFHIFPCPPCVSTVLPFPSVLPSSSSTMPTCGSGICMSRHKNPVLLKGIALTKSPCSSFSSVFLRPFQSSIICSTLFTCDLTAEKPRSSHIHPVTAPNATSTHALHS